VNGKILHSDTLPNTTFRFKVFPGKYMGMLIACRGTNAGGATVANTDFGIVQVLKAGQQKDNFDFECMQQSHNTQELGAVENASALGAAFNISCYVPFVDVGEDVALDIQVANEWEIVMNCPNIVIGLVASGTIEFVGVQADDVAVSPYEIQVINHHISPGAAGTFVEPIYAENVDILYIEKDTALTHLGLLKDGRPFVDYQTVLNMNTLTNLFTRTETFASAIPYIKLDLNPTKDEAGNYNNDIKLQYTVTGACTIKVLVFSKFLTPDRLIRSTVSRNSTIEQKAAIKAIKGLPAIASRIRKEKVEVGA